MRVDVGPRLHLTLLVQGVEHQGFLGHHVVKQELDREGDAQELTDPIAILEILEVIHESYDQAQDHARHVDHEAFLYDPIVDPLLLLIKNAIKLLEEYTLPIVQHHVYRRNQQGESNHTRKHYMYP